MNGAPSLIREYTLLDKYKLEGLALQDKRLSKADVSVLHILLDHADKSGCCYPGMDRIARMANISKRTVIRATANLEAAGYVGIERGGYGHSNHYLVNLHLVDGGDTDVTTVTKNRS